MNIWNSQTLNHIQVKEIVHKKENNLNSKDFHLQILSPPVVNQMQGKDAFRYEVFQACSSQVPEDKW